MLRALQRTVIRSFISALMILAAIWLVSLLVTRKLIADSALNDHTRQVINAIDDLHDALLTAQGSARAYLLVPDAVRLGRLADEQTRMQDKFSLIRQLTRDNPSQQERLRQLDPILQRRSRQLSDGIAAWKNGQQDRARDLIAGPDGEAAATQFQISLDALRAAEGSLLQQRLETAAFTGAAAIAVTTVGGLLAIALVYLAFRRIRWAIAERIKAQDDLDHARRHAEAANRSKTDFLANMSHEIRTPVAAVIGYADLLLDPDLDASERLNSIHTIRRNGQHLLTVINDILDLSKVEAGQLHIEQVQCAPCQVISDVASMMRVRALEKDLQFEVRIDGRIPECVRTDSMRLRQILINLLGNAVKFTDAGWVRLIIKLATPPEHPRPKLRFDVIDTGIGMAADQIHAIFKPFVQGDNSTSRRFGGTGLGLSISRRLAQHLGGDIFVESVPGRGSTFALEIETGPLDGVRFIERCSESTHGDETVETLPSETVLPGNRASVLVADDGIDNRNLLAYSLRKAGFHVEFAENGRIAVQKVNDAILAHKPFDVVLMDMQMPELDGYSATSTLRNMRYDGVIIALTAHAMKEDREKCLAAGCTDYLSKPVDRKVLIGTVRRYLTTPPAPPVSFSDPDPAEDLALKNLRRDYIAGLPLQVARLSQALAKGDRETIHNIVHQLRGTGGLFELGWITHRAIPIDEALRRGEDFAHATAELPAFIEAIRQVEGYDRSREAIADANGTTPPPTPQMPA